MESSRIDDQIREYYQRKKLPDETRVRLAELIRSGVPAKRRRSRKWLAVAAAVVILATASWMAQVRLFAPNSPHQITAAVAQYAASGHNERQELDFRVSHTSDLRRAMKSLDFTPVEPAMMSGMNMRLVGARYATIEGVMAAQIVYLDPKGERCTLYELRPVAKLAGVAEGEHNVDGLRVSVWHEKGLLMILARPLA